MENVEASRTEIEDIIVKQALGSKDYRAQLIANPREMVERQIGQQLPESVTVQVVQEAANKILIKLPHVVSEGDELADEELEQVAGGKMDKVSCNGGAKGAFQTKNEIKLK